MDLDEVDAYLSTLDGVRSRGTQDQRAWYVDGLLVARTDGPGSLLVRLGGADRERFVTDHPETFGVPPRWEAHTKMQSDLGGDDAALRRALHRAWEVQRAARDRPGHTAYGMDPRQGR